MPAPTVTIPVTGTDPKVAAKGGTEDNFDLALKANFDNIEAHKGSTANPHSVTKAQVGLGNVDNTSDANKPVSTAQQTALDLKAPLNNPTFTGTVSGVTKAQVGLGNVDNTSDANKPISTATQNALDLKAPKASPTFTGTVSGVTKAHVGLGDVNNTSDADKPVSDATQAALNAKADTSSLGTLAGKNLVADGDLDTGVVGTDNLKPASVVFQKIPVNGIPNSRLAQMGEGLIKGRSSGGGTGDPENLSAASVRSILSISNVDNTSDADKPISAAQQAEFLQSRIRPLYDALDGEVAEYPLSVRDVNGQTAGFNDEGEVVASGAELPYPDDIDAIKVTLPFITDDGEVIFALRSDGFDFVPSARFLERVSSTGYLPASSFSGDFDGIYSVRQDEVARYGVMPIGEYTGDIVQLKSLGANAIPVSERPLEAVFFWGQSNAGHISGPNEPEPLTGYTGNGYSLALGAIAAVDGGTTISEATATDFNSQAEPVQPATGQLPAAMFGYAMPRIIAHYGARNAGAVISTSFKGGTPLDKMRFGDPDNNIMDNMRQQAVAAKRLADVYGRDLSPKFFLIQGEAGPDVGWQAILEAIEAAEIATIAAETGAGTPQMFIAQINTSTTAGEDGSAIESLQWARDNLDVNHAMTGPMYDQPLSDVIHSDNMGRMLGGEVAALAYYWAAVKAREWHPLWPTAGGVTRSGAVITIPFELPDMFWGVGLKFDDDWIADIANKGFSYDDDSAVPPSISSVEINGLSVVITLDTEPTGANKVVRYGMDNLTETTGWAACRGLVYADSGVPSPFHAAGYAVPPTIRLRSVRFEESLT